MSKVKLLFVILAVCAGSWLHAAQSGVPKGYEPSVLFMADSNNPLDSARQRERYLLAKLLMPEIVGDSVMAMPVSRAQAAEAGVRGEYYDYVNDLVAAFNKAVSSLRPDIRRAFIERHKTMRDRLESLISLQYIHLDGRWEIADGLTDEIARDIGFSNEAYVLIKRENRRVMDEFNALLEKYSRNVDIVANLNEIFAQSFSFYRSLFIEAEVPLPGGASYVSRQLERELRRINKKYSPK